MIQPRPFLRRCRPLLGSYVEIGIDTEGLPSGTDPCVALEQAFAAMREVQVHMSFHCPMSDLSRINSARAATVLEVHPWTADVLALAQQLHTASEGRFDCGVGAALRRRGLLPRHPGCPVRTPPVRGTVMDLQVDSGAFVGWVRLHRQVCLDLGGIAKGFAVDRAIDVLAAHGAASAVVNAGGDLRVLGALAQPLHVRWPGAPAALVYLGDLADGAAATSATYFSRRHLLDPATDRPLTSRRSFTVLASLCAVADGLTKALAVDGALDPSCLSRFGARAVVL